MAILFYLHFFLFQQKLQHNNILTFNPAFLDLAIYKLYNISLLSWEVRGFKDHKGGEGTEKIVMYFSMPILVEIMLFISLGHM